MNEPFSGVPLGGLGTGTLEIRRDGAFHQWQIFNNWGNWQKLPSLQFGNHPTPLTLQATFFALRISYAGKRVTKLLETQSRFDLPAVKKIEYEGRYPTVHLTYLDPQLENLNLSLIAFSPFIPHDSKISSIPAVGFIFKIKNNGTEKADLSLLFSAENPFGRKARVLSKKECLYLCLDSEEAGSGLCLSSLDGRTGVYFAEKEYKTSCSFAYQMTSAFQTNSGFSGFPRTSESPYGAVKSDIVLQAGEEKEVRFILSWFFLKTAYRDFPDHFYANEYHSAFQVAQDFGDRFSYIYDEVKSWLDTLYSGNLPYWLKNFVANSLYIYSKNTFWSKNGQFGILESFECPSIDNLHVRYYGAMALSSLFLELEKSIVKRHADAQLLSGRLCEEFDPGTNRLKGKDRFGRDFADLFSCFVLEVYRYVFWTGDLPFMKEIWPGVKKALRYGSNRDTDNDGLPNMSNGRNTYDIPSWDCGDQMSYTGSLWLASLLAGQEMAKLLGDEKFLVWCRKIYAKGVSSMEKRLYNGEFYVLGETNGKRKEACMVDQLAGQWGANLVGLEHILPEDHIHSAIRAVFKYNAKDTHFGATNSIFPDGKRDTGDPSGKDTRFAESIWPAVTLAFATLAIQEGYVSQGLSLAKKVYQNFTRTIKDGLWNMVDVIDPDTGLPHPYSFTHYQRNGSAWGLLGAVTGFNYNGLEREVVVVPPGNPKRLVAPFVTPQSYGILIFRSETNRGSLKLCVKKGFLAIRSLKMGCNLRKAYPFVEIPGKKVAEEASSLSENGVLRIVLKKESVIRDGQYLSVKVI